MPEAFAVCRSCCHGCIAAGNADTTLCIAYLWETPPSALQQGMQTPPSAPSTNWSSRISDKLAYTCMTTVRGSDHGRAHLQVLPWFQLCRGMRTPLSAASCPENTVFFLSGKPRFYSGRHRFYSGEPSIYSRKPRSYYGGGAQEETKRTEQKRKETNRTTQNRK